MSDKQSIKDLGSRAIASTMFYLSIMAFIIFIFIDLIIVVALIVELVKGGDSVVGILVGMLFSFTLTSLLARASLKYDKKRARPGNGGKSKDSSFTPQYEIEYKDAEGVPSRRKISLISFDGKVIEAYCFLRHEERTFYIPRIVECVDLSTGEVVDGDLRFYFASLFKKDPKPCDIYRYEEWSEKAYSSLPKLPEELHEFELDEKLNLTIITFKDGERNEPFYCGKIFSSTYDADQFYIQLVDSSGEPLSVGFSKILHVEGADSFSSFVLQRFYQSDKGRAVKLISDYRVPLSILIYMGRVDSSLNAAKRRFICEYMQLIGADCSDDVLVKASRKVKVELPEFKKFVNVYSKFIEDGQKGSFLSAVESIVGGREKAKPFGLAGLQYIESKIKI